MKHRKRYGRLTWLLLAVLVIILLALSACATAPAPAPAEPQESTTEEAAAPVEEPVTIKWLLSGTWPVEGSGFLEEFNKAYPNINVEMEQLAINGVYEAIQVRVGGGDDTPDVFIVNGPMTAGYGYNEWLMPLDDLFTDEEKANWNEASVEIGTYDGQLISAPIHNSTQNLYYNKGMLEAAGITPPGPDERWTWEQVTDAAQQLTKDEDGDGVPDIWGFNFEQIFRFYQLQPLAMSKACCESIDAENLTVDGIINSDEWVEAFTWYGDLYNELGVAPQGDVATVDQFVAGQLAMMVAGPWNVNRLAGTEDLGFEWGISRHPYFEGGEIVTPTSGWHLGVNANTQNPEAAREFVHWFTTEDGGKAWFSNVRSALSAQESVNEWIATDEQYAEEPWNYIRTAIDETTTNPVIRPPVVGYIEYSQLIESAFSDIRNGADPKEALDLAVQRIESELAKYR